MIVFTNSPVHNNKSNKNNNSNDQNQQSTTQQQLPPLPPAPPTPFRRTNSTVRLTVKASRSNDDSDEDDSDNDDDSVHNNNNSRTSTPVLCIEGATDNDDENDLDDDDDENDEEAFSELNVINNNNNKDSPNTNRKVQQHQQQQQQQQHNNNLSPVSSENSLRSNNNDKFTFPTSPIRNKHNNNNNNNITSSNDSVTSTQHKHQQHNHKQQQSNTPRVLESDYDKSPTPLYLAIELKRWNNVLDMLSNNDTNVETDNNNNNNINTRRNNNNNKNIKHCTLSPVEQTKCWVIRKENDGKLRWRLLPIHAAIIFDANYNVIEALLEAYPESASQKDDQGMLPLHLAFRNITLFLNDINNNNNNKSNRQSILSSPNNNNHNNNNTSSSSTAVNWLIVEELLTAYPQGIFSRDRKGRTPLQGGLYAAEQAIKDELKKYKNNGLNQNNNNNTNSPNLRKISALKVLELYSKISITYEKNNWYKEYNNKTNQRLASLSEQHLYRLNEFLYEYENNKKIQENKYNIYITKLLKQINELEEINIKLYNEKELVVVVNNDDNVQNNKNEEIKNNNNTTSNTTNNNNNNNICMIDIIENEKQKNLQQELIIQELQKENNILKQQVENLTKSFMITATSLQETVMEHIKQLNNNNNNNYTNTNINTDINTNITKSSSPYTTTNANEDTSNTISNEDNNNNLTTNVASLTLSSNNRTTIGTPLQSSNIQLSTKVEKITSPLLVGGDENESGNNNKIKNNNNNKRNVLSAISTDSSTSLFASITMEGTQHDEEDNARSMINKDVEGNYNDNQEILRSESTSEQTNRSCAGFEAGDTFIPSQSQINENLVNEQSYDVAESVNDLSLSSSSSSKQKESNSIVDGDTVNNNVSNNMVDNGTEEDRDEEEIRSTRNHFIHDNESFEYGVDDEVEKYSLLTQSRSLSFDHLKNAILGYPETDYSTTRNNERTEDLNDRHQKQHRKHRSLPIVTIRSDDERDMIMTTIGQASSPCSMIAASASDFPGGVSCTAESFFMLSSLHASDAKRRCTYSPYTETKPDSIRSFQRRHTMSLPHIRQLPQFTSIGAFEQSSSRSCTSSENSPDSTASKDIKNKSIDLRTDAKSYEIIEKDLSSSPNRGGVVRVRSMGSLNNNNSNGATSTTSIVGTSNSTRSLLDTEEELED